MSLESDGLLPGVAELSADFRQRMPYPTGNEEEEGVYGRLTNGQRIIGFLPRALQDGIRGLSGALMRDGLLPPSLRQMIIVRVGYQSNCIYEIEQHRSVALKLNVPPQKLDALAHKTIASLDDAEIAAISFVDELIARSRVSDASLDRVRTHFSDAQVLEMIFVVGNWWTLARLLETAGIPLDEERIGNRNLEGIKR